jgi:DNA polymerase III epsilon subunit-like protein
MPGALVLDTEFNTKPFRLLSAGFVKLGKRGEPLHEASFLIQPHEFVVDEGSMAFRVHGISHSHAASHGVPIDQLLTWLAQTLPRVTRLVGHNVKRDIQLLKEEARRNGADDVANMLHRLPVQDTMHMARGCGLTELSLERVHCQLFGGSSIEGAHDALCDARHTAAVFGVLGKRCGRGQQPSIDRFFCCSPLV